MIALFHKYFLYHKAEHIERPTRVLAAYKSLKESNIEIVKPKLLEEEKVKEYLYLVHDKNYVNKVWDLLNKRKEIWLDSDTYISPKTKESIIASVSAVVQAIELLKDEDKIIILNRPPGHHSGYYGLADSTLGFCIFNFAALTSILLKKAIILDIDLHHGNGTEDIIKGKRGLYYISTHAKGIYPGTGYESYENICNFPLEWYTSDEKYIKVFDKIKEIIESLNIDNIVVSLGWDAHKKDHLSVLNLTLKSYKYVFEFLKPYKVIFILEGGYNLKVIYNGYKLLAKVFTKNS